MLTAVSGPSINEIFKLDPIANEKRDQFWGTVWKVAQIAAIAIFIVSSTAGFIVTSIFYPTQVLGVTLAIYTLGLYYATQLVNYLGENATFYSNSAIANGKIIKQLNLLSEAEIPKHLENLQVTPSTALSQNELKLGLAQYFSLKQEQADILERKAALEKRYLQDKPPQTTAGLNWEDPKAIEAFDTLQEVRINLRNLENRAAFTNVMAAHTLKLIHSPEDKRPVTDFGQFNPLHAAPLLIAKAHGDLTDRVIIKTDSKTYTNEELLNKEAPALAREIFHLPGKPWKMFNLRS